MATADELLATTSESADEILVVDLNTRLISIPASLKILGVEADDDVKQIYFSIPRYYGDSDLSEFNIRVNFENARHGGDFYPVKDVTVTDDDKLSFIWLVDRTALKYAGDVNFSICMKKYDAAGNVEKELNTTLATLPVLKGLETSKEVVENNPSAMDTILYRLYAVEAATGNGQNGYYTVAKINETGIGVEVTIIGSNGTEIATIKHGNDGYTPVKGNDYWTAEDKAELKSEVLNWAPFTVDVTLPAASWVDNKQIIAVDGVFADSIIDITAESNLNNCVKCIKKSDGELTFKCTSVPTTDIVAHIAVYCSTESPSDSGSVIVTDDGEGNVAII